MVCEVFDLGDTLHFHFVQNTSDANRTTMSAKENNMEFINIERRIKVGDGPFTQDLISLCEILSVENRKVSRFNVKEYFKFRQLEAEIHR